MASFFLKLKESFRNAFRGLVKVYGSELTFRIQFWWGVIVVSQIFYWPLGEIKQLILLLLVLLVLLAEILNTTFEDLFDIIEKRHNARVGYLKDILAGGVLLMAIGSATIGTIIFWPYILKVITWAIIEAIFIVVLIYSSRAIRKIRKRRIK